MAWGLEHGEVDQLLRGLRSVGARKVIGYLPNYTITDILGLDFEQIRVEAGTNGLTAMQLGPDHCCIKRGGVYVYDRNALKVLLELSSAVLRASEWPVDPDQFVRAIACTWVGPQDPVLRIIKEAFDDCGGQTNCD